MPGAGKGLGWKVKFDRYIVSEQPDGEFRAYCPLHEDPLSSKTPSASFNFEAGKFMCFSRCGGYSVGRVWSMMDQGRKPDRKVTPPVRDISTAPSRRRRGRRAQGGLPEESKIEEWHSRLLGKADLLRELHAKRGLNRRTLAQYRIGWDGERITIPIRNDLRELVNVRRYGMGLTANKMVNWPGYGDATLYGLDALKMGKVILTEGEMDKLLGRQYRFPTLSATAGAGTWLPEWNALFVGKTVYICYDADDQGDAGARKVANQLRTAAKAVHIVKWPMTAKGSDLTNYFVDQGYGRQNFLDLLKVTPPYREKKVSRGRAIAETPVLKMRESFGPQHLDKPVTVVATVSGRSASPSALPRRVELLCGQDWQKPKCGKCPMETLWGGSRRHEVSADDPLVLKMLDTPEDKRRGELLGAIEIPRTCPRVEVNVDEQWRVDELAVVPNVDDPDEGEGEHMLRRVFNVTDQHNLTPVNTTAKLTGVSTASPKDGHIVFQSWLCEETKTSLDTFHMTEELRGSLENVFQPGQAQSPMDKLHELARDLAANVTHIYGRPELHIGYDLVWHSVLDFSFRSSRIGKGWLELLVMGDTRTGKSEAAERLRHHYQCGVLKSCEGATLAGLVGGAQQIGNNWVITWGTIPLQDRRLVILDEVSGISDKGILEQMSAVRSSGKAQVSKIVSQETFARTRLIWISNPVDGRFINQTNNGAIDAIQKLVTNPEDIARFDMAMVAAQDDVDSSIINGATPPKAPPRATRELSSALATWAWSRTSDQVVWASGVERHVLAQAEEMGSRYIADPPLIQPENVRMKLARISVAIAARLFSHDGTGTKVVVLKSHVDTAVQFLDMLYGKRWFGYADHSRKELRAKESAKTFKVACRLWLGNQERVLETLKTVINDTQFRARDFEDFGGLDREMSTNAVGELLRMGMVRRRSKGYISMMPELIELVREMEAS